MYFEPAEVGGRKQWVAFAVVCFFLVFFILLVVVFSLWWLVRALFNMSYKREVSVRPHRTQIL